eukprot:gene22654-63615_t
MALNLFVQNKKVPEFKGHKSSITCLAEREGTGKDAPPKAYIRLQFHADGIGRTSGKKKKGKHHINAPPIYRDIRLLLVTERSLCTFYDVSIPGAPNKLADYYASGSYFRDAHFHTLRRSVLMHEYNNIRPFSLR